MSPDSITKDDFIFTRDILNSISNWQRGWLENQEKRREIADELVRQCEKLPVKFREVDKPVYRKRFILDGEIIPILIDDEFFEGIAAWTTESDYAKGFKGIVRPSTKFVMLFKHHPLPEEIVVNIVALWNDEYFRQAVEKFKAEDEGAAKPLLNFSDKQSEVILRSTLKGSEIEDIVGVSSSFDDLCDMAGIPEDKRRDLSIKYARDPNGLPIEIPSFAGTMPTKEAINNTLIKFRETLQFAMANNVMINWSRAAKPNPEDLKHKPKN